MSPSMLKGFTLLLTLAACLQSALAETFTLADAATPSPHSLNVIYKFYVRGAPPDNPNAVDFKEIRVIPSPDDPDAPPASSLGEYKSLQILIMREEDFEAATASRAFCTEQGNFLSESGTVFTNYSVSDEKGEKSEVLMVPGVYYLVISNCGRLGGLALRGTIAVKPTKETSFLSPLEQGSQAIYVCSLVFYIGAFLVWAWACFQVREQTMMLQKGLCITLAICCVEALAWWLFFQDRSKNGGFSRRLFTVAALASSYKLVALFYSVITNPGKGVHSDQGISFGMHLLPMLFLIFSFNHTIVQHLRHGYLISFFDVLLSAAPTILMGLILILVAVRQVSGFIQSLEEEKDQDAKVAMYRFVKGLIFFAGLSAAGLVLSEVLDVTATTHALWHFEATMMHGLPQLVFIVCIALVMMKAWPSADLQGYAYEKQDKGEILGAPGLDDEDDDIEVAPPGEGKNLVAAE